MRCQSTDILTAPAFCASACFKGSLPICSGLLMYTISCTYAGVCSCWCCWAGSCNFYRWNKLRGLPELLTLAQHYLLRTHSCTVRDRSTANPSFGPSVGCALQCTGAPYTARPPCASPPRLALGGPTFYLLQRTPPRTATRHLPSQPQHRRFHQRHICQVNRIQEEELLALWAGHF